MKKKKCHLIFVRTKGGIAEDFGRIQRGDLKFAWKMKSWDGGGRVAKVIKSY